MRSEPVPIRKDRLERSHQTNPKRARSAVLPRMNRPTRLDHTHTTANLTHSSSILDSVATADSFSSQTDPIGLKPTSTAIHPGPNVASNTIRRDPARVRHSENTIAIPPLQRSNDPPP